MVNRKEIKEEYRMEAKRAQRVSDYLNILLIEFLPQHILDYEVVHNRVKQYVFDALGEKPVGVSSRDEPTYEFYVKPKKTDQPRERVMILHGPDLRARIPGGIKNERAHFYVDLFKDNLEKAIAKIESSL